MKSIISRILQFFGTNYTTLQALKKETMFQSGVGNTCIAFIKAYVVASEYRKSAFPNPFLQMKYDEWAQTCFRQFILELEQLKTFSYNSKVDDGYSLTGEWWRIKDFLFEYDPMDGTRYRKSKADLKTGFELKDGDQIIGTFPFEPIKYVLEKHFGRKTYQLCYVHCLELVKGNKGYTKLDKFLGDLYRQYKRYPYEISLYGMQYDFLGSMINALRQEIVHAFHQEFAELDRLEPQQQLQSYEEFERGFIFHGFTKTGFGDTTWISDREMQPWQKELYDLLQILWDKKDNLCFQLGSETTDLVERNRYLQMIRNKELRERLGKL